MSSRHSTAYVSSVVPQLKDEFAVTVTYTSLAGVASSISAIPYPLEGEENDFVDGVGKIIRTKFKGFVDQLSIPEIGGKINDGTYDWTIHEIMTPDDGVWVAKANTLTMIKQAMQETTNFRNI
jgi:hypothetical protein